MKKWIGILVALSLVLVFSLPAYAQQKAKSTPIGKEAADKMMEECYEAKEPDERFHSDLNEFKDLTAMSA